MPSRTIHAREGSLEMLEVPNCIVFKQTWAKQMHALPRRNNHMGHWGGQRERVPMFTWILCIRHLPIADQGGYEITFSKCYGAKYFNSMHSMPENVDSNRLKTQCSVLGGAVPTI